MKYLVGVNVRTYCVFEIEAENEDEARKKALEDDIPIDRMGDFDYDLDSIEEVG